VLPIRSLPSSGDSSRQWKTLVDLMPNPGQRPALSTGRSVLLLVREGRRELTNARSPTQSASISSTNCLIGTPHLIGT